MAAERELLPKLREIERLAADAVAGMEPSRALDCVRLIRSIAGYLALKVELEHKRKDREVVSP